MAFLINLGCGAPLELEFLLMEKHALACLMKKNTSDTGKWIAERSQMGHGCHGILGDQPFRPGRKAGPPPATRDPKKLHGALIDA
jgi:hypothetical protein